MSDTPEKPVRGDPTWVAPALTRDEKTQRLSHQRLELRLVGGAEAGQDLLPHARLPAAPQVAGDIGHSLLAIRHGFEEAADLVGHGDQLFQFHASTSRLGCGAV
jgi:hypothetical protein